MSSTSQPTNKSSIPLLLQQNRQKTQPRALVPQGLSLRIVSTYATGDHAGYAEEGRRIWDRYWRNRHLDHLCWLLRLRLCALNPGSAILQRKAAPLLYQGRTRFNPQRGYDRYGQAFCQDLDDQAAHSEYAAVKVEHTALALGRRRIFSPEACLSSRTGPIWQL